MTTNYTISITMNQNTVSMLSQYGYSLYVFKAVGSSIPNGQPTVWIKTRTFNLSTTIYWENQYAAYTSLETNPYDGTQIYATAMYPINLGSTLQVTSSNGTGLVVPTGTAGAIEILNEANRQFTCGISQTSSAGLNILSALPVFGNNLDVIQPVEQVFLTFATNAVNIGTVIDQALAPSLMVDMTGATNNSRSVSYDINSNWQANTESWATQYPATTELAPLLIKPLNWAA